MKNGEIWGTLPKKTGQTEDMGKFIFIVKNVVIHKNTSLKM